MVARRYDVNANQVFSWRRRYREASEPSSGFIVDAGAVAGDDHAGAGGRTSGATDVGGFGRHEIEVSGTYRVRVDSSFDPRSLKRVLDVLRRR